MNLVEYEKMVARERKKQGLMMHVGGYFRCKGNPQTIDLAYLINDTATLLNPYLNMWHNL
jgi:hypothetical protein